MDSAQEQNKKRHIDIFHAERVEYTQQQKKKETVGQFLFRRLHEAGCNHCFGVPGDFVLGLMNNILKSDIKLVGTCNELNAAYAADGYARLNGIGLCCTTYAVGELSAINGIAGAFAESVPVVKLTGAPAREHFSAGTLLHHTLGDYSIPSKMYSMITGFSVLLNKLDSVVDSVDKALTICMQTSSPVYIAVCTDIVEEVIDAPVTAFRCPPPPPSDPGALNEAVDEVLSLLSTSKRPIVLPGMDLIRSHMKTEFETFIHRSGLPYATMILGKGILDEEHNQFIGLYQGSRTREYVKNRVEEADLTIILGEKMTDFNTGGFSTKFCPKTLISVERKAVTIKHHTYNNVYIRDFLVTLTDRCVYRSPATLDITPATQGCTHRRTREFVTRPDAKLTQSRIFDRIAFFLPENSIFIAETGSSLFAATECMLPKGGVFMAQTFYGSIGFTVGATLGACLARPNSKVVTFIGDGSFQVTCQDLSTMIRYGCKPIVILINNDGYLIERVIVDRPYNDIQQWKYSQLCDVFGGGKSYRVETEGELEKALTDADNCNELMFLELILGKWDCNNALKAAGRQMAICNNLLAPGE